MKRLKMTAVGLLVVLGVIIHTRTLGTFQRPRNLLLLTRVYNDDSNVSAYDFSDRSGRMEEDNDPIIKGLTTDLNLRYYMYEDDAITHASQLWESHNNSTTYNNQTTQDDDHDDDENLHIFYAFRDHPLRTYDPNEADVFLVPLPFMRMRGTRAVKIALQTLIEQPSFGDGHGHFFISQYGRWFDEGSPGPLIRRIGNQWGPRLYNMTFVRTYDIHAIMNMAKHEDKEEDGNNNSDNHGDWNSFFPRYRHQLGTGVSMGLVSWIIPYRQASWERFLSQPLWINYHCRKSPFRFNSTQYRIAPLNISWPSDFPVDISYDIPHDQWITSYLSSKFCLVIRGDDPNSHGIYRSIEAGCIPVVVSDYISRYSPPFPRIMRMEDYCHFIPESDFIRDPRTSLLGLRQLNDTYLRRKIHYLRIAQRVISIRHPQSLFVEAIIKEVHSLNPRTPPVEIQ